MNALEIFHDRYIKAKIRIYVDKVYTNFRSLNVPEDGVECESFTIISLGSLLVYENKFYLQIYSDNFAYKIVNTQMIGYLHDNLFESDESSLANNCSNIGLTERIDLTKSENIKNIYSLSLFNF